MPNLDGILVGIEEISKSQRSLNPTLAPKSSVAEVIAALSSFGEIVRYLNTRRSKALVIADEAAVQDVLYMMLRPWVHDLVPENPTDKVANTFAVKDFLSRALKIVVEAKFVRNRDHGKGITKELNHDIETYRYHPSCDDLIFFIYDPENHIPDTVALEHHIRANRIYEGKTLRCHAVIKP